MESIFRGCGGLKRTDFSKSLYWQGVVITISMLGGCNDLERIDFDKFLL